MTTEGELKDDLPVEIPPAPAIVTEVLDPTAEGTITGDLYEFMFEGSVVKANGELVAINYQLFSPDPDTAYSFFYRRARRRAEIPQDADIEWGVEPSCVQVTAHVRWCVAGTIEGTDGHNYRLWVHLFNDGYEGDPDFIQNSVETYLWALLDIEENSAYVNWLHGPVLFESPETNPAPIVEPDAVLSMRQGAIIRRMITRLEAAVTSELEAIGRHENKIFEGRARIRELRREIADAEGIIPEIPAQGRLL